MSNYRSLAALGATALISCASGASVPSTQDPAVEPVVLQDEAGLILGERPKSQRLVAPVAMATAWKVAPRVYAALKIPATIWDPATQLVGNKDFWKARMIADMRMSDLVDCGVGMTGKKADTYRIYMSLLTRVSSDGKNGTVLETTLSAIGQDVTGGNADRIPCGSTGVLESVINESIRNNSMK